MDKLGSMCCCHHFKSHDLSFGAPTWVVAVIETTKDGTEEQLRLTRRPSANIMIRLPSGQMMCST